MSRVDYLLAELRCALKCRKMLSRYSNNSRRRAPVFIT
jgi:hypothetical protein